MSPRARISLFLLVTLLAVQAGFAPAGLAQAPAELLTNPGFEQPYLQSESGGAFLAQGWSAWWLTPGGPDYPTSCTDAPVTCKPYTVPSYRNTQPQDSRDPPRARSGDSQQWGATYALYVGGIYQRVSNITPGARLRFTAHVQSFNCSTDQGCYGPAGEYGKSYEPGENNIRLGIDPAGGTDPFSSAIVWSASWNPIDVFVPGQVEAVAQAGAVTVFVSSAPQYPELHLVTYIDDASLTVIGQGPPPATATATTLPVTPQPTSTASPGAPVTVSPSATTQPGTAVTYALQEGDTLFGVAIEFNLTLDELLALNPGLTRDALLQVGQTLVVGNAAVTPTAGATPAATATPSATPAVTAATTSAPSPTVSQIAAAASGLCLLAFDDVDGNGAQSAAEPLLAGAQFDVKDAQGASIARYTTTGADEPHCLSGLPEGRYTVDIASPENRQATSDTTRSIGLLLGQVFTVNFGSRARVTPAAPSPEQDAPLAAAPSTPGRADRIPLVLLGVGFLALAVGMLVLSLRARRQ